MTTCSGLVAEWGRPLIVPMTVLGPAYVDEIFGRLREVDQQVRHFCLTAPAELLRARVEQRATNTEFTGLSSTQLQQMLEWVEERGAEYDALDPRFAEHIDTTNADPQAVADRIAAALPHPLPARLPSARWADWAATGD